MYIPGRREDSPELPLNLGGSCIMAFSLFANGAGPANETDAPLDTDSAKISDSVALLSEKELRLYMDKSSRSVDGNAFCVYFKDSVSVTKRRGESQ